MFKKLTKIGMLAALMVVSTSAFAQKEYTPEYPHYGFWSNWSIALSGSYHWQLEQGPLFTGDNAVTAFRHTGNAGMGIAFEKELNYVWSARLRYNMPSFWKCAEDVQTNYTDARYNALARYSTLTIDFKLSLNDAFRGYYKPERRGSIYLFGGAGSTIEYNNAEGYGKFAPMVDLGLGFSYKVCEHSTLFVEVEGDIDRDIMRDFSNTHLLGTLGWMFNFGPTAVDRELIAARALLTQENFDALNNRVSNLENELANSKANEQRLQNRVNELENEVAELKNRPQTDNSAVADSLQNVINNIKANQGNFYSLPFSILYGVDEYNVPASEESKLKAIAQVMKDNEDMNFTIVGYCDYTGSDEYNMKLSQKRAENAKKALVNKYGIDESRLTCDWKGKGAAYGDIKLPINRRVSFYANMD